MNKNENDLSQNISDMKDEIQKSLKKLELIKELYNKENENENNLKEIKYDELKIKNKSRTKRNILHVTYFIPILQFLDIKYIIELSKVNHLFYSFIYSFYFYRSVNQILIHSNKKINNKKEDIFNKRKIKQFTQNNKDMINKKNTQDEDNLILGPTKKIYSSFMSALTGALSYIAPIPEMPNTYTHKEKKNDLEEIGKKLILHEKLLNERIKQLAISNEIKNTRAKLDKYIKEQYDIKKNHKKNELNKNTKNNFLINDQTIKKIKREKYESEYNALLQEINNYENEYNNLKKDNEKQSQINVELEIKLNKIKYYAKNTFKIDENLKFI